MASSITTTNIDATFPVAGQDNDSQGFRDNFSQIKTQLSTASTEITSLQANRATTNADADFNGQTRSGDETPQLIQSFSTITNFLNIPISPLSLSI